MLMKQTSDRSNFVNTTNYGSNIYLDKLFTFFNIFPNRQLLVLNRRITWKIAVCYETVLEDDVAKIEISTSEIRPGKLNF